MIILLNGAAAEAATAESKYYAAERCYRDLRNNPAGQKYRDQWLRCINKFMSVYEHDTNGPWAAAGLYKAGDLYAALYRHSFSRSDLQEALKLYTQVIRSYPTSRYKVRAEKAKRSIQNEKNEDDERIASPKAREWYKRAQAQYQRLQEREKLKKYRDQWFKSIDSYRKAYQEEPDGPLAAASLYGLARRYEELYAYSYSKVDQIQARKTYEDLLRRFPNSPYAEKAKATVGEGVETVDDDRANDAIAQVIEEAGNENTEPSTPQSVNSQTPAVVEGLRYWSNPRYTRVVIDANQDTVYTYHELREDPSIGKPQRIYIDVHNSRLSRSLQKTVPINDNLLSDARAGQYAPDTVRVVVDIKSFKTYKIFSLKNPFRIVLDVWGVETAAVARRDTRDPTGKAQKLPASAIVKQLALGVRRIVIDPGHGGKDYGAPGYLKGVHEKDVVLKIGRRLAAKIREQLKCDVLMTRKSDEFLSLEERTAIANTQNADLFISIHTNASPDRRAYGVETFILNLATDDEAIRVAARENATSTKNISDLDSILQDLMQNAKVSESTRLASYVQQAMLTQLKKSYKQIRSKGVKQAPFYVLLGAEMPSILVETAFISNPRECKRLVSSAYQERLCQGIIDGIKRYIAESRPVAFNHSNKGEPSGTKKASDS